MYCSIDRIDLATRVDGQPVAIQTDHRSRAELEAAPELTALYAMARVLNARQHFGATGAVHYVVTGEPPAFLRDALAAVGGTLAIGASLELLGPASSDAVDAIADRAFASLARRAANRIGTRDLAVALRMLEDQTFAAPPARADEPSYWQRVLELGALAGELLRAKYPHASGWVCSDRATVPFGFGIDGSTMMFPTNRAQRVIEDGADESLFKLLVAVEETLRAPPDVRTGRLMPSLRDRRSVELDEVVWRSLLADDTPTDLPIVVCGIDGETTFGMIRREALEGSSDDAMARALASLADEHPTVEDARFGELRMIVVSGSYYAAEKLLDRAFMRRLHARLAADVLCAAVPARGLLVVTTAELAPAELAKLAALVEARFEEAGGRAISPTLVLVRDGAPSGYVHDDHSERAETTPIRADTAREHGRK